MWKGRDAKDTDPGRRDGVDGTADAPGLGAAPAVQGRPGVIDVNALGGFVKQYQVLVDPAKLRKYDLTLHEIYDAVAKNNANAGGNVLERHAERSIVRGLGLIKTRERYRVHHRERGGRYADLRA